MKKVMMLAALAAVVGMVAGCASTSPLKTTYAADGTKIEETVIDSLTELGKAYYAQPNMAKVIEIEGTNLLFSVSGATRFCLSSPVPPKQIIPRDTSWYSGLVDTMKTIAPWIFMGYLFHEADFGDTITTTTTGN